MAALVPPCRFPEQLRGLYDVFIDELSDQRTFSHVGAQPLTDLHFAAWQYNTQVRLSPFDIRVLRELDRTYLRVHLERSGQNRH